MKIAVSSTGKVEDSEIDSRFGRCPYFMIVDTDNQECEPLKNEYQEAMGGAGIQTAQMLADRGIEAVITGNVGPNAFQTLDSAGITIYKDQGTVKNAVERFNNRELDEVQSQTVRGHFGKKGKGRGGRR